MPPRVTRPPRHLRFSADTERKLDALSPTRRHFVLLYLRHGRNGAAAVRAMRGKGEEQATRDGAEKNIAREYMQDPAVRVALDAVVADWENHYRLDTLRTVEELVAVGYSDIGEILDFSGEQVRLRPAREIPARARRALASMKVKRYPERTGTDDEGRPMFETVEVTEFRLHPKLEALEKLARIQGLLGPTAADAPPGVGSLTINFNIAPEGPRYDQPPVRVISNGHDGSDRTRQPDGDG